MQTTADAKKIPPKTPLEAEPKDTLTEPLRVVTRAQAQKAKEMGVELECSEIEQNPREERKQLHESPRKRAQEITQENLEGQQIGEDTTEQVD